MRFYYKFDIIRQGAEVVAHDVFISYSQKNKNTADAVCNALENNNIRCWIAPRDITPGKEWGEAIVTAISEAKVMVLIFSAASNESQQVLREVERAVNKNVIIIPFRIEDVVPTKSMEYFLYSTHWLDALTHDMSKHIAMLTGTVSNLIGSGNTNVIADGRDNSLEGTSSGAAAVLRPDAGRMGEKKQAKSKSSRLLLIAACVVVLLAVAFGVYGIWFAPGRGNAADAFTADGQQINTAEQNEDNDSVDNAGIDDNNSDLQPASDDQSSAQTDKDMSGDNSEIDSVAGEKDGSNQADGSTEGKDIAVEEPSSNVTDAGQSGDTQSRDNSSDSGSKGTDGVQGPAEQATAVQGTELKVGDYIGFGKYYGQPVVWRVINVDDEGCPLLLSDKLLSFKCFDAAERDKSANEVRKIYGSNLWENSNIREWLNSSAKTVSYSTSAPIVENVCYGENSSANEPGFLAGFTAEEQELIKTSSHEILLPETEKDLKEFGTEIFSSTSRDKMNRIYGNYDSSFGKTVKDKVFLLSVKELRDYVLDRGWDIKAAPTPQAEARDESDYEELKHETDGNWSWWLSTPCATTPDCVYYVSYDGYLDQKNAFLANTCIRPAMYLTGSKMVLTGSGTAEDPYVR